MDDDEAGCLSLEALLSEEFEVAYALGVRPALAQLEAARFEVLVADFRLGDGTGIEVIEAVASRWPETTSILLTGQKVDPEVQQLQRRGRTLILFKPIDPDSLLTWIRNGVVLSRVSASRMALEQAERMEAIGRLASGVAHDFNNMLCAIGGYADALRLSSGKPELVHRFASEIKRATGTASALTRRLLAFSRSQPLEPSLLDLNAVVTAMRGLLEQLLGSEIELRVDLVPTSALVRADAAQLEQVFLNLALNARDAMRPRGGRLTITTGIVDLKAGSDKGTLPDGRYVTAAITDTGAGIPPKLLAHLFEPFFTTKLRSGGTGLGLATVHGVMRQSGGDVVVSSDPGRGTTFHIYLPHVEGPLAPAPSPPAETLHPLEPPPGRDRATILLVEDEGAVRSSMSVLLEGSGFNVLAARDATEALVIEGGYGERIDLLVSDVVMPGLSGPELAAKLEVKRPGLARLFVSGHEGGQLLKDGFLPSGFLFLAKPFSAEALVARVREALHRRAPRRR